MRKSEKPTIQRVKFAFAAMLLTVLGVVAGLAPASRAMAIKPVDAMRDE